ncbi:MAG: MiaB/RimO family radical SAM methylthiotransferase [Frankia sp.]
MPEPTSARAATPRRVAVVTLGCSRNEVDSEELAGRLGADGWTVVDDPDDADAVLVNTCGFVEAAKKDSIDTLLEVADQGGSGSDGEAGPDGGAGPRRRRAVVAVGCLAERYGAELADSLPEADAVLGFDAYPTIGAHLDAVLRGERPAAHTPRDRRTLLPISPVQRRDAAATGHVHVPGHGQDLAAPSAASAAVGVGPASGPPVPRRRLAGGPVAALKLASGCDRRCSFCAIPSFRGSHVSRTPDEILAEAEWLARDGVRELVLVSENTTSYGKDLGDLRALEKLLPQLAAIDQIVRVRTVYLQPAEIRPSLLEAVLTTPGVAPYLDLSFQHASPAVLRRMRRFGGAEPFLELLARSRAIAPDLGARSNVIVGFPGESRDDVETLVGFLEDAALDAIGVFAYSDEDGTEAATLESKVKAATINRRHRQVTDLAEHLTAARAADRVGGSVEILVEQIDGEGGVRGRAAHQQPEVDGDCSVRTAFGAAGDRLAGTPAAADLAVGDLVRAVVVGSEGIDLVTELVAVTDLAPGRDRLVPALA